MALSQATLKNKLLQMLDQERADFIGFPASIEAAASLWTDSFDGYAALAEDISGDGLETANKAGFEAALVANLPSGDVGTAVDAASVFETAFTVYFTGAVFNIGNLPPGGVGGNGIFGIEISSIVTTITLNVLKNALLPVFTNISSDVDAKAEALAGAFHLATTNAVICTISGTDTTPPPLGPLPIVNVSPIH